jgi:Ice-binding-like
MSRPIRRKCAARAGTVLAVGLAFVAMPVAAQASAVDLGTAKPFVALGGQTVTNTGPSVLGGNLGVAPGTALTGFGLPAVVNGEIHAGDAVAGQAQSDLTNAYNVAAGQPVLPADDLTGQDLGGMTLTAGAYHFSSSAQLTGTLTLNAQGNSKAQFVFEIGSTLTTAPASQVVLTNGASPCNVYWQIGSSATLDTTTAFQGNVMALTSISMNNGASVIGRVLARNGSITLINNVLNNSACSAGSTPPPVTPPPVTTPPTTTPGSGTPPGSGLTPPVASSSTTPTHLGTAKIGRTPGTPRDTCKGGFSATVRGKKIKQVVFKLDGKRVATRKHSPFRVLVHAGAGRHTITARVRFTDATHAKTLKMHYRACAAAALQPLPGPSQFTG